MTEALILWSHALAALLLAVLVPWAARRPNEALPRWPLVAALAMTALWALAIAGVGPSDPTSRLGEALRNLGLLALMASLHRRAGASVPVGLGTVYGVVVIVVLAGALLQFASVGLGAADDAAEVANAAVLLRMMVAVAALVLAQNIHVAAAGAVRIVVAGIAAIWLFDLTLATTAYLSGTWSRELILTRGVAAMASAGLFAAALQRRAGPVQVSRTVTYQSLSLVAVGGYVVVLALATSALAAIGGQYARTLQTAFVFGSTAALLTLVSSTWLRAWLRVKIAKHLFRHRYDYRAEWLRFSGTLGAPEGAAGLDERVARAIAELTESPGSLLFVPDGSGLGVAAGWNWPVADAPNPAAGAAFARHLSITQRIVELDAVRRGEGTASEIAAVPQWLLDRADAWAVVPLLHLDTLVGAVLLARPTIDRALDWEDFDLLRIAGRQVASHLAEARARDALAESQRFDEFNRRFAFIVHDIKNLVSGLTLVARNAERHADNPAFRADMVATLQDSAAKLNGLLARLSQQHRGRHEAPVPTDIADIAARVAAARRSGHPIVVRAERGRMALADAARLEQALGHLVQNAIEASAPTDPVTIAVEPQGDSVVLSVIDSGCGMSPAYVREQLFRPFASSKPGGFGIGAFEARQLVEGFGATLDVESREDAGTTFRILLPAAQALPQPMDRAA